MRVSPSLLVSLGFGLVVTASGFAFHRSGRAGGALRVALPLLLTGVYVPVLFTLVGDEFRILPWALGGMFVVLGLGILGFGAGTARRAEDLRSRGLRGEARVESVTDTGWKVLNRRVLHLDLVVQVPGRDPYRVRHRARVHDLEIPLVMSGAALPVAVDPDDPDKVLLQLGTERRLSRSSEPTAGSPPPRWTPAPPTPGVSSEVTTVTVETPDPRLSATQLLDRMLDAEATIVSIFDLDVQIRTQEGDPVRGFELDVRVADGRAPYRVRIAERVPARLPVPPSPGMTVDVEVDAADPSRVTIVWDLSSPGRPSLGIEGRALPSERAVQLGIEGGVEVGAVAPGAPADRSGLRAGDVITRIRGERVTTFDQLAASLMTRRPGDTVDVTVRREGRDVQVRVTLGGGTRRA